MGDPLSPIMSGFFMEDLENKAITTLPTKCRHTFWERYVDDILEKIKIKIHRKPTHTEEYLL